MAESVLKFAIVGCGKIAQRHAEHINNFANLAAVCDIIPAKADELAKQYNCTAFYSMNALIKSKPDINIISICTPNGLHAEQTIMSLKNGFHVLCEKPMAIKYRDCLTMLDAAQEYNKKLFVVKQNRYNPSVVAVKKAIDTGMLGKIYSVQLNCFWNRDNTYYQNSWRGTKELDGGILFTQFSHFIDLLYWLIGDVKQVYALTENYAHNNIIEFEDAGVVAVIFQSGAIGSIHFTVNSFKKNMEGSLTIFAENGTVKIGGEYLNKLEYQCIKNFEIKDLPVGNSANNYGTYFGSMSNHDKVYEYVIAMLSNKEIFETNAYEAMKTVEIIEKIYSSARSN